MDGSIPTASIAISSALTLEVNAPGIVSAPLPAPRWRRPQLAAFLDISKALLHDFGEPLLRVRSTYEIDEALERAVESPQFWQLQSALQPYAREALSLWLPHVSTRRPRPSQKGIKVIGRAAMQKAVDALAISLIALRAGGPIIEGRIKLIGTEEETPSHSMTSFVNDETIPISIKERLLKVVTSTPAALALLLAFSHGRQVPQWRAKALAARWYEGQLEFLTLLASTPGIVLPDVPMPTLDRLNATELREQVQIYRSNLDRSLEAARRRGYGITAASS